MAQRRLAAIMFTDIVGYTSLMGSDEKKAFNFLRRNRRIHWRLIRKYRGRLLKEVGDGILARFNSNIDAVMCAISIQNAAQGMEIPLRIGIHQGDVIFEKKDVLGDGVNIASRIQGVAETNEIIISETVYRDIKNKEGLEIKSLGTPTLKGVDTPVSIFKVSCRDENLLDFTVDTGELIKPLTFGRTTIIVSIILIALISYGVYYFITDKYPIPSETKRFAIVFPFDNYLGSDSLNYVVEGMHEELIWELGKISDLKVVSKTTANAYKNTNKSILEIEKELGVNTFVEGALLTYLKDSVSLHVKVFDDQENELLVQDYSVEKSQILDLYNTVTKEIAKQIGVILSPAEERRLAVARTVDVKVYDLYLKSHMYWEQLDKEALNKAKEFLNYAIERDPNWAPLYSGLANVWVGIGQMGFESPKVVVANVYDNLNKALELDPNNWESHLSNAFVAFNIEWNWEKAEKEFLTTLALNPNDAMARVHYAHLLAVLGRFSESLEQGKLGIDLDPLNPLIQALYSGVLKFSGDYQSALTYCEKSLSIDPDNFFSNSVMELLAFDIGDHKQTIESGLQWLPLKDEIKTIVRQVYKKQGFIAAQNEIIKALEEYSKENYYMPPDMAMRYLWVNNVEKALDWLEKGYEIHDQNMTYIYAIFRKNELIKDNPRFIAILKKMNLPIP